MSQCQNVSILNFIEAKDVGLGVTAGAMLVPA